MWTFINNLNDYQLINLEQAEKEILLEQGKQNQILAGKNYGENHTKQEVLSIMDKTSIQHNTQKELAKSLQSLHPCNDCNTL